MTTIKKTLCFLLLIGFCLSFAGCNKNNAAKRYDYNMQKYVLFEKNINDFVVNTDSDKYKLFLKEYIRKAICENGVLTPSYDKIAEKGDEVKIAVSAEHFSQKQEFKVEAGCSDFQYPIVSEQLIGKKSGDVFTCKMQNIDNTYIMLTVDVISVNLPVLTEEVSANMGYGSKEICQKEIEKKAKDQFILDDIRKNAKILDYPKKEYEIIYLKKMDYYKSLAAGYGMTLEDYKNKKELTGDEFEDIIKKEVHAEMDDEMPIYAILRNEKLKISDEQITDMVKKTSQNNGYPLELGNQSDRDYVELICARDVVLKYVKSKE